MLSVYLPVGTYKRCVGASTLGDLTSSFFVDHNLLITRKATMDLSDGINHFARLPCELRYRIYGLVMARRERHLFRECIHGLDWHVRHCHFQEADIPVWWTDGLTPSSNFRTPTLLRVCKQFRDEAFGLFLRDNLFSVDCSEFGISHFTGWLDKYGPYAKHIRYLRLTFGISHDSVYRSFFPGADPLDSVGGAPYILYVTSYINKRSETVVDQYHGPRMDFAFKYPWSDDDKLEVSRNFAITKEAELGTVLQPFLRSLDADGTKNHDTGVMDAFELFVKHSVDFGNGSKLFVELWQECLWLGVEELIVDPDYLAFERETGRSSSKHLQPLL